MKVSEQHFGAIYSAFPQDSHFVAVMLEMGAHISRWPGGTLAELRSDVYDISSESILDPTFLYSENADRERLSISEAIGFTGDSQTLNVIVPTYRYEEDLELGLSDLNSLLTSLASDSTLIGKKIRLEIGNEYYALDRFSPESYGSIANTFVSHINSLDTSNFHFDLEVSVQLGKGTQHSSAILSEFNDDAFERIDAVNTHILPINLQNLYLGSGQDSRFDELSVSFGQWESVFSSLGLPPPEHHVTAWTVGEAANSTQDVSLQFQDYGARGGATTLALFGEMLELGVSEAAVWGVGVQNLNSFGRVEEGSVVLSHAGTVFSELSDSVVGFELLSQFGNLEPINGSFDFGYQAYIAPGQLVLYAVNGESEVSSSVNLSSVPGFDSFTARLVEAKEITTSFKDGYVPTGDDEDRLFELPVVRDVTEELAAQEIANGWWEFKSLEGFEINEISFSWRHAGTDDNDLIDGVHLPDEFFGASGNDTLLGASGDDTLVGGQGHDRIDGGMGDDILFGDDQSFFWNEFLF